MFLFEREIGGLVVESDPETGAVQFTYSNVYRGSKSGFFFFFWPKADTGIKPVGCSPFTHALLVIY